MVAVWPVPVMLTDPDAEARSNVRSVNACVLTMEIDWLPVTVRTGVVTRSAALLPMRVNRRSGPLRRRR